MLTTRRLSDEERKQRKRDNAKRYRARNREKIQAARRAISPEQKARKLERLKKGHLLRRYGITAEQRDALLEAQGFTCAICFTDNPGQRDWATDHCHKTGRVRGLLCSKCNLMLGHARDDVTILSKAISYLKVFNGEEANCPQ